MSQWCFPRHGNRAVPTLAAAWLFVCAASCGPQTVPYPGAQPRSHAGSPTPTGTAARSGSPTAAGTTVGGAGIAATTVFMVGGHGGFAPTPTSGTQTGAAGRWAGTDTPGGAAGTAATGGEELAPFDAGTDPNRNRAMPGGLCARLATIQCAAELHCCRAPGRSTAECQTSLRNDCEDQLYLDVIANNAITGFDPTITMTTFTELETRSASCDLGIPGWSLSAAGIRGILKGTRAPGENCKPSTAELTDKAAQAAALTSCTNSDVSACLPKSLLGEWKCSPRNPAGGGCATDENCDSGTYCQIPQGGTLGKCAQRVPVQGACTSGVECTSYFCSADHQCVAPDSQLVFCPAK